MIQDGQLLNYIGGAWKRSRATEYLDVRNPATAETMVRVPLSPPDEVDEAVQAAQAGRLRRFEESARWLGCVVAALPS